MVQPVVTRSQRRVESKQLCMVVVLILAVAGASFYLGMLFGQQSGEKPGLVDDKERQKLPAVAQIKPPPKPAAEGQQKQEKLTFYDNLPKGKQAPLGSGINLPPQQKKVKAVTKQTQEVKVSSLPPQPLPKVAKAPPASADGVFVVQVASFRTSEDAKKLAARLLSYKLTTFVEKADLGEKGVWHRVLSGPFATRENADAAARLLRDKERLSALVRQR
jgi:cell division septation protein DedD